MNDENNDDSQTTDAKPIRKIAIDEHSNTLIYYNARLEPFGVITVQTWAEGLEIWVGGEVRYRSWKVFK
jgi:hypothetical protein